jgi:hypothetical protein
VVGVVVVVVVLDIDCDKGRVNWLFDIDRIDVVPVFLEKRPCTARQGCS